MKREAPWTADHYVPDSHGPGDHWRSPLNHPPLSDDSFHAFIVLFGLMNLNELHADCASMLPLQLAIATLQLARLGWPVELRQNPTRACWQSDVPQDVLDAWRKRFGARGQFEIMRQLEPISQFRRLDKPLSFTGHPSR